MRYIKSEAKDWARAFYRGLECIIMPSFTPEELALDEIGIRHDVRELIKHGCFSIAMLTEIGTTVEEDRLMLQCCVEEAEGRVGVNMPLRYRSLKENIEMARFAEEAGCDSVLLRYPPNFHPTSPRDIIEYTRAICEGINLAVVLFPSSKNMFPFPGGIPAAALKEMGEIENVVAMKAGISDYTWLQECFRLFGDKVLISYPHDDVWAIFIRDYGMQWSGSGLFHVFQTPDDQREVRLFNLFQEGKMDEAMELHWKMDPWRKTFQQLHTETYRTGGLYHFQAFKYAEELVGMTGGEVREPKLSLFPRDRDRIRQAMLASGLNLVK